MHFKSLIYVKNPPIGIILCTSKKQEQIELLGLENSNIHVSEYLTLLPPKELLEQKDKEIELLRRLLDA